MYRNKLEARIAELELENERLRAENSDLAATAPTARAPDPVPWIEKCPMCGTDKKDDSPVPDNPLLRYRGYTYPRVCEKSRAFFYWNRCVCAGARHLHQSCTSCKAEWICTEDGVVGFPGGNE